jgi:hypothetical protein
LRASYCGRERNEKTERQSGSHHLHSPSFRKIAPGYRRCGSCGGLTAESVRFRIVEQSHQRASKLLVDLVGKMTDPAGKHMIKAKSCGCGA